MNARKLNKITVLISGLVLLSMVLAACAPAAAPAAPATTQPPAPVATTAPAAVPNTGATEATINVATDPKLGKVLVDSKGMTLYMFAKDTADKSNCNAGCLAAWPPLKTLGHPTLGDGVDASLVGSAPLA